MDAMMGIISCATRQLFETADRLPVLRLPRRTRRLLPPARPAHHGVRLRHRGRAASRWRTG
jgi:hypothetical protein